MSKDMSKLLKQAQKMQSDMMKKQEELAAQHITGTAGGNMVSVTLSGGGDLIGIKLDPEVVDKDDVEMLEDLIVAAFQNASEKVKEMSSATFGALSSGLKIPGLM